MTHWRVQWRNKSKKRPRVWQGSTRITCWFSETLTLFLFFFFWRRGYRGVRRNLKRGKKKELTINIFLWHLPCSSFVIGKRRRLGLVPKWGSLRNVVEPYLGNPENPDVLSSIPPSNFSLNFEKKQFLRHGAVVFSGVFFFFLNYFCWGLLSHVTTTHLEHRRGGVRPTEKADIYIFPFFSFSLFFFYVLLLWFFGAQAAHGRTVFDFYVGRQNGTAEADWILFNFLLVNIATLGWGAVKKNLQQIAQRLRCLTVKRALFPFCISIIKVGGRMWRHIQLSCIERCVRWFHFLLIKKKGRDKME